MDSKQLNLDFEDLEDNDDKHTITLNSARNMNVGSPLLKGMDLDLSFAGSKDPYRQEGLGVQEQEVLVVFELPDGSQGESRFKLGQTVEFLKSFVEQEYSIPMQEQELYIEDRRLLNPLSLLDYSTPEVKGLGEVYVRVEGLLPAASRK
ncbi:hypothetical protein B484DRAFT_484784 [Ochromonadaceae sp. CCMP2298]|nr:hypothetical protein B484DRAFT_484784 [Ochromonadaceae sp. CCMP2298]